MATTFNRLGYKTVEMCFNRSACVMAKLCTTPDGC